MSDELRQMADAAVTHALKARDSGALHGPIEHALTSLALSFAYLIESDRVDNEKTAAERALTAGLCYDHMDEAEFGAKGSCRVEGCEERARRT